MFAELIELLRCPNAHEESPLIASAERTVDRRILEGTLGCPVCRAEFPIRRGVATFGPVPVAPSEPPSDETAMRLAAFLELNDPRRYAIIGGRFGSHADELARITDMPLVLVNPPTKLSIDAAANIRAANVFPFAPQSAHAAIVDVDMPESLVDSIVRAVRPGGRVVGPASLAPPAGVREIVRDNRLWVAEKIAAPVDPAPRLVTLKRA